MSRMFTTAALSLTALVFAAGSAIAADAGKCTIAKKGDDNPVAKACETGGIKEAKKTMKAMVKVAKDKGKKMECDACHKNEEDWKLSDDAEKNFKDLLAAQK